jgi:3-methyladenine DNA glycosylase AlkC
MRIGLTLSFFSLSFLLFSQDLAFKIQDSLPQTTSLKTSLKDSLQLAEIDTKLKTDSLKLEGEGSKKISKLKKKRKRVIVLILNPWRKSQSQIIKFSI